MPSSATAESVPAGTSRVLLVVQPALLGDGVQRARYKDALRALGQTVAIAIAAAVAFVWAAAAVLAFAFRFSQHTDDGPTCFHGTPVFAVAQALVAVLGIAALL